MLTATQKRIVLAGIKVKLARGEKLEDVLAAYVSLSAEERKEISAELVPQD